MRDPDLPLLIGAARHAGEIGARYWRRAPQVWDKPGTLGPVTEADLAVNAMLHETLRAARPGYGWLSEETEDNTDRLCAQRVFLVDPIDGTRAFIAGEDTYAHVLAVAEAGRITAGVVWLPQIDVLYAASLIDPATRNGHPVAVSRCTALEGATLIAGAATLRPEMWRDGMVPRVERVFRASLAYRMCLVAEGHFDAMVVPGGTWEWDIAAGSLIVARAGGVVSDRLGAPIAFNAPHPRARGLIAGPGALHAALVAGLVVPT